MVGARERGAAPIAAAKRIGTPKGRFGEVGRATLRGRPHAAIKHELHYIVDGTDQVTRGTCGLYFAPDDRIISVNLAAGDHCLRDEGFRRGATAKEIDHGWDVHPGEPEEYHFEHSWMMSELC